MFYLIFLRCGPGPGPGPTCSPGLRGSMKRRTESALPNTTLQCGAGMVVRAVIGFLPSTASYERICFPVNGRENDKEHNGVHSGMEFVLFF